MFQFQIAMQKFNLLADSWLQLKQVSKHVLYIKEVIGQSMKTRDKALLLSKESATVTKMQ